MTLNAPAELPVFTDIREGLDFLDAQRDEAMDDLHMQARAKMDLDAEDPSQQQYFVRIDRNTVVKDEAEYVRCQLAEVSLRVVPYSTALQLLKEESARKKGVQKLKAKKKSARAAKKRNR